MVHTPLLYPKKLLAARAAGSPRSQVSTSIYFAFCPALKSYRRTAAVDFKLIAGAINGAVAFASYQLGPTYKISCRGGAVQINWGGATGDNCHTLRRRSTVSDSINPYLSPLAEPVPQAARHPTGDGIERRGNNLLIPNKTVFPELCVVMGQPIDPSRMKIRRLYWVSPVLLAALLLLGGVFGVAFYFMCRKECRFKFGVHPDVSKKYRNRLLIKLGVLAAFVAATVAAFVYAPGGAGFVLLAITFIALLAAVVNNRPLSIGGVVGHRFVVRGFGPNFLEKVVV
jgi:hypothetical protein